MVAMVASVSTVLTNSFAGRLLPVGRPSSAGRTESGDPLRTGRGRSAQLTLQIPNMHCEHCLESIKEAAYSLHGVEDVVGDPEERYITVTYRQGMVEPDGIREAIVERGFQVSRAA
jgi:copper chaperone CopZ